MNELRILRGRDIGAAVDGSEIFGLTELTATAKPVYHEVFEYLRSAPFDRINEGCACSIKLKMLSMFSSQVPMDRSFTLSVSDDSFEYSYEDCRVVERHTEARGDKGINEVFLIKAEKQTKRVIDDE
nr:hypothetical protein [uncultured Ruminococcus sp.]